MADEARRETMSELRPDDDIGVVGLGCRFPRAPNVNALWRLVRDGETAFETISDQRWRHSSFYSPDSRAADKTYATKGAFIDRIDEFAALHYGIAPRRLQVTDPQQRLLVETVRDALQDAGYDNRPFDRANTGVFVGASVSEYKELLTGRLRAQSIADGVYGETLSADQTRALSSAVSDVASIRSFTITGSLLNMMAATVSQVFDLSGPSFTLDAACSSALVAIHEAVLHLRTHQCHVALAGGVYLNLTPDNLIGFSRVMAITPSGPCRPFDARADGFIMGEGIGVVVLKRLADARRDGDRVYAVIRGSGCNNDGRSQGPMTPRPEGQVEAMRRAHADAGNIPVETIEFVETHGTATTVGDVVEIGALKTFFHSRAGLTRTPPYCYLGSIKANIGHTMSAAGVAGFIKAVLAVQQGVIPPQPSAETPNHELGLDRSPFRLSPTALPWKPAPTHPRRAAVSSFGFGGTNAHILLEQAPDQPAVATGRDELFLVSAPTAELLSQHLQELVEAVEQLSPTPAAVALTLATRTHFDRRVAFIAKTSSELLSKLRDANAGLALRSQRPEFSSAGAIDRNERRTALESVGREFLQGDLVDARTLMQERDHTLTTLPPTPLERQRYWAIDPSERLVARPLAATRLDAGPGGRTMPNSGHYSTDPSDTDTTATQATQPDASPHRYPRHDIESHILASVARISAFPETTLRLDQVLTEGLGFDSLMLVDLDEDIRTKWPNIGGLPFDTLPPQTTILDVVENVVRALEMTAPDQSGASHQPSTLSKMAEGVPVLANVVESTIPISRFNHVYLDSHVIDGKRVMPFAAAMDHVAAAAMDVIGAGEFRPFTLREFRLKRPVQVSDTIWLKINVRAESENGRTVTDVTLGQNEHISYRGRVSLMQDAPRVPTNAVSPSPLPLPLREFYDRITFHGPLLQGIASIDGFSPDGITGTVRGSAPSDWIKQPLRKTWTIDPLIIDCGFQLAAYWIWAKHGLPAFPLAFDEYTQLAPFGAGPLKCTARIESVEGGVFRGTLVWSNAQGDLLAFMREVAAEAKTQTSRKPRAAPDGPVALTSGDAAAARTPPVPATYRVENFPEYQELKTRLKLADTLGVNNPYFIVPEAPGSAGPTGNNGPGPINFSSYNYINNSGDPVVSAAAKAAIEQYGTSVSASRLASGQRPLHAELERELASFLGTEDCLVFTSGHATNVTVIGHIVGPEDLILHDELAHDSILQGAKLSGAKRRPFPHNDFRALDQVLSSLREHYRRVLVCIEGAYSMDGDIPDLPAFVEVKTRHRTLLFVDEAHSIGVVGKTGRGIGEYYDVARGDVDIWMGTLSKAFASCGGYIGGSRALIEYLKYTTPGFVYSVGISPPNAAAALAALRQVVAHPERVQQLQARAKRFVELMKSHGIDTGQSKDTAVVPAIIGDSVLCLRVADRLNSYGINVQPIIYPAVAEKAARLRFFLTCEHTDAQLATTADILAKEIARLGQNDARTGRP
jgi:8-amino-7-oxononanoate synthase